MFELIRTPFHERTITDHGQWTVDGGKRFTVYGQSSTVSR